MAESRSAPSRRGLLGGGKSVRQILSRWRNWKTRVYRFFFVGVAELVDALGLGPSGYKPMRVQISPPTQSAGSPGYSIPVIRRDRSVE